MLRAMHRACDARIWVFLPVFLGGLGCGVSRAPEHPRADVVEIEGVDGQPLDFDAMIDGLMQARVIYVGERHDVERDHHMQLRIAAAIGQRDPSLALGFEMFHRGLQPTLDEYRSGRITEAAFLERTEWDSRWGFDFAMYRPLVELGRSHDFPLLALNAPREVTRTVARQGIEVLGEEARAALPDLDLEDATHRALVTDALSHHGQFSEAARARLYTAQVIWDETMASAISDYLARPDAAHHVVIFAGTMHVARHSIPMRAARRVPHRWATVMPVGASEVVEMRPHADILWIGSDLD